MTGLVRIAQVIHTFLPESTGGSEIYTYCLSRELAKRHSVSIFYRIADPHREEYTLITDTYNGLPVVKINNTFKGCDSFRGCYRNDLIDGRFDEFLDHTRPDVVHFHHLTCLSTNLIRVAKARGIPVVFTLHDFWLICQRGQLVNTDLTLCHGPGHLECLRCLVSQSPLNVRGHKAAPFHRQAQTIIGKEPSMLKTLLGRLSLLQTKLFLMTQRDALDQIHERWRHVTEVCGLVDLFIAPSRFLRDRFIEQGIPSGKILFSRYGHQDSRFAGLAKRQSDRLTFGYLGTLIPTKGVHVLVEAFNRMAPAEAELHIYGHFVPYGGFEDYPDLLQGLARDPRIRFMGGYQHGDVADILTEIDVLIVPSIWYENSPLTIHEAFLAKTPVIASDIGGMAELIQDGINGLLFRTGSARDLCKKMERIIRQPDLIGQLSANIGPVKTIEENALEIQQIYHDLIAQAGSPRNSAEPLRAHSTMH